MITNETKSTKTMRIRTKFKLMYWPMAVIFLIPAAIAALMKYAAEGTLKIIEGCKEWVKAKAGYYAKDERGITILNPKLIEEIEQKRWPQGKKKLTIRGEKTKYEKDTSI